jgi:hypothetical protein
VQAISPSSEFPFPTAIKKAAKAFSDLLVFFKPSWLYSPKNYITGIYNLQYKFATWVCDKFMGRVIFSLYEALAKV